MKTTSGKIRTLWLRGSLGLLTLACLHPQALAGSIPVPWSAPSIAYEVQAESGVDHYQFANRITSGNVVPTDYALAINSGTITSMGATLPVPLAGHTTAPQQILSNSYHYNQALTTTGRISGDPSGTIRMEVGGESYASQVNVYTAHYNKWEGGRALAEASFVGEFPSTGSVLDYTFNGQLDRSTLANPSTGLYPRSGIFEVAAWHELKAHLLVEDLTNASTLFNADIYNVSQLAKGSELFDILLNNIPFNGSGSVDLTGTQGNTVRTTLLVSVKNLTQVECQAFSTYTNIGGMASASGAFDFLDINFTTNPVPEPSTLIMAAIGLMCIAFYGRGRK